VSGKTPIADRGGAELRLLQFLCGAKAPVAARKKITAMLAVYSWSSADRTIFFECICELLEQRSARIFEELPAAVTRRGFPDMNCEVLATDSMLKPSAALVLARALLHL